MYMVCEASQDDSGNLAVFEGAHPPSQDRQAVSSYELVGNSGDGVLRHPKASVVADRHARCKPGSSESEYYEHVLVGLFITSC